jgi:hypothetical protein
VTPLQIYKWVMVKAAPEEEGEEEADDSPLVDGEHAGAFLAAMVNHLKATEGEEKALQACKAAELDPRKLYPSWAGDAQPKVEKVGLAWLL